ncbi:aminotransferase class I/II-fold pyridoxal phosphate-dependent enzyme [Alteromonas pelagimontana]|uniref:cysteine-S-conjugate beta-lyase n=1 Tax=Alteromonas pelagimontana TaxID=1858656 RepID=A0A6M4M844_9ALTE|nr:aminotransferase class I/II-fold pyridoxal phosphate-dependent enzyme [Alteromonas pelagimontana]QJR79333.1 aminotransferase class I/II-fold pyridoxal phosphate-dependent enzyme [Alteromonas pelagimontana]
MKVLPRKGTGAVKFDGLKNKFGISNDNVIPLWIADMDIAIAREIVDAITNFLQANIVGYVDIDITEAVCLWHQSKGEALEREWITSLSSVLMGIRTAITTFTQIDDKIMLLSPVYSPFYSLISQCGRTIHEIPLVPTNSGFAIDIEKLNPDAKMLLLCNPNNPTGSVWPETDLQSLVSFCVKHNILVIADEVHSDFIFNQRSFKSVLALGEHAQNITIVLNSCAKSFNLAAIPGAAYAIIPNSGLRGAFHQRISSVHGEAGALSCVALNAAYRHGEPWLAKVKAWLRENRAMVANCFRSSPKGLQVHIGDATYFAWLDFTALDKTHYQIETALLAAGVALTSGKEYGAPCCFRMNLATSPSLLEAASKRITRMAQKI